MAKQNESQLVEGSMPLFSGIAILMDTIAGPIAIISPAIAKGSSQYLTVESAIRA